MMSTALTVAQLPHSGGVEPSGTGYRPDSGEDVKGLFVMFKYSKLAAVALIAIAAASSNVRAEDAPADPVVAKVGADSRAVVRPDYSKIRKGGHYVLVDSGGVWCSVPPVVGPDPEPDV